MTYNCEAQTETELKELQLFIAGHPLLLPEEGLAVPTFHSIGVYWNPPGDLPKDTLLPVRFCEKVGVNVWREGWPMFFDPRLLVDYVTGAMEYRGRTSLVHLKPGTTYLIQMGLPTPTGPKWMTQIEAKTRSEAFKLKRINDVTSQSNQLTLNEGGNADEGFVVYDGHGSTIDVRKGADWCIRVDVNHVILRNFRLKGPRNGNVLAGLGVSDLVVEDCELTDWGSQRASGSLGKYGFNSQAAVTNLLNESSSMIPFQKKNARIVVQRNMIHDPTFGTNDWTEGHPLGPHAVYLGDSGGQNVIRYNDIFATVKNPKTENKWFNDALGANSNVGDRSGYPGSDSDIYQNSISCTMDDGIEAEGHGRNVRIWWNRLDFGDASHIATNVVQVGPTYAWRNIAVRPAAITNRRPTFGKTGDRGGFGGGKRFIFHNTTLNSHLGCAISDVSDTVNGVYARNNVWSLMPNVRNTYQIDGKDNSLDHNMSSSPNWGQMPAGQEAHGWINTRPVYKPGHGAGGFYQLDASSKGKGAAEPLPLFNRGEGSDIGIQDEGDPQLKFGVEAGKM
jgi:hypothetical protein